MSRGTLEITPTGRKTLTLGPQPGGTGVFLSREGIEGLLPVVEYDEAYAESPDTEGGRRTRSKPKNPVGRGSVIVSGKSRATFEALYTEWERAVEEVRRYGGQVVYTPAEGEPITYLAESMRITSAPYDGTKMLGWVQQYDFEFTCLPYGLLEEVQQKLRAHDAFTYDSITNADWGSEGEGELSVSGGALVPAEAEKATILYRDGLLVKDAEHVMELTSGESAAGSIDGVLIKRIDSENYLWGEMSTSGASSVLQIMRVQGGKEGGSVGTVGEFELTAETRYWLKATMEGNSVTVRAYSEDPRDGAEPIGTAAEALLTSTLAELFGEGKWGNPGLHVVPVDTAVRYNDWSVDAETVRTTNPVEALEVPGVEGSVDALGDLTVTEKSEQDRRHLEVGLEAAATSYEQTVPPPTIADAAIMEAVGLAELEEGVEGARGETALVSALSDTPFAICRHSGQYVGPYRAKARVKYESTFSGIYVRVGWRTSSSGAYSTGDWAEIPVGGQWCEVDLGVVRPHAAQAGEQHLEVRLECSGGEANVFEYQTILVDYLEMLGASRWCKSVGGDVEGLASVQLADAFNQEEGAATGKEAKVGGTYSAAENSDATDFTISEGKLVRTAISDSGTIGALPHKGRAIGTSTEYTDLAAQVDFDSDLTYSTSLASGLILSYVNNENFVIVYLQPYGGFYLNFYAHVRLADGTHLTPESGVQSGVSNLAPYTPPKRLTCVVSGNSLAVYTSYVSGASAWPNTQTKVTEVEHEDIGAEGRVFIYDVNNSEYEVEREYDNFVISATELDAALYAGRSARLRSSDAIRESEDAANWGKAPGFEGARLRVPPAGSAGAASRLSVKARRRNVDDSPDEDIEDQIEASLALTPRVALLG